MTNVIGCNTLNNLFEELTAHCGNIKIKVVDIGARGDIPPHWLPLDGEADFLCFDADPEACTRLKEVVDSRGNGNRYKIFPMALAKNNGSRILYLTNTRSGSSIYDPGTALIREYINADYLDPIEQKTLETKNAREVFHDIDELDLDMLKLDIQGAELEVLESMGREILSSVVAVELEANMLDRQNGSPTFADIHAFMSSQGFDLFDMRPNRVHSVHHGSRKSSIEKRFKVHLRSPSISARLWQSDFVYFRPAKSIIESGMKRKLNSLIIAFCVYGFYPEALNVADLMLSRSLISEAQHKSISNATS